MGVEGRIVIVGAGIGGLVCALELQKAGRDVIVLEREAVVGGRVRSSRSEGYTADRGFQVLFTAYPTLCERVNLAALEPRRFVPGVRIVARGGARPASLGDLTRPRQLGDAGQRSAMIAGTLFGRTLGAIDKLRVLALRRLAHELSIDECFAPRFDRLTAREFLGERGMSDGAVARFFAPFYGGILLDPELGASASVLLFTLKMLADGDTVVPAKGMGALAAQLASRLRSGTVRTSTAVARLTRDDDGVTGAQLTDGERIVASHVVLATDAPVAAQLAGAVGVRFANRPRALGSATVWLASREHMLPGRAIWLNADERPSRTVLHAVTMSDVAPEYVEPDAPFGPHLIAATAVGEAAALDDATLVGRAIEDVRRMAHGRGARTTLTAVALERVPFSQFAQPPGSVERRTTAATSLRGLWRASETAHTSSLEGAARGGVLAAAAILSALAALPPGMQRSDVRRLPE